MSENAGAAEFVAAVKEEIKSTYEKLDRKTSDLHEVITELKKSVSGKADTTSLEGHLSDLGDQIKKLEGQASEIERKANRAGLFGGGKGETKTTAELLAETDEWKSFQRHGKGIASIEVKAITSPAAPTARTPLQTVERLPGIIRNPEPQILMRDLIPVGSTGMLTIEYAEEDVFTNNAAVAAEDTLKPESNITFKAASISVVTIAHWVHASKQILDDVPQLQSYIDGRLRDGLVRAEDAQLLNGNGQPGNIKGLLQHAIAYDATDIPTAAEQVDHIRWAKLQVRKAQYPATAVVLNPEDWAKIELAKDKQGSYLHAAVTTGAEPRLWGLRVVENDAVAAGKFLVGAFSLAAQIWDREQSNVVVSTEDRDNLIRNLATIRAEERVGLAVYRPKAFVYGTFPAAPPAGGGT